MDDYAVSVVGRSDEGWESITCLEDVSELSEAERFMNLMLGMVGEFMSDCYRGYHEVEIVLWDSDDEVVTIRRARKIEEPSLAR